MCNKEWKDRMETKNLIQSNFQMLERIEKKMLRMGIKLPQKSSEYLAAERWANHPEPRRGGAYADSAPKGKSVVALSSNPRVKGYEGRITDKRRKEYSFLFEFPDFIKDEENKFPLDFLGYHEDVEATKLVDEHVSTENKSSPLFEDEFKDVPESVEYDGPPIWDHEIDDVVVEVDEDHKEKTHKYDEIDDVVVEVDESHKEKTTKFSEVLCDVVPMRANHIHLDSRTNHFEEEGNDRVRSTLSVQSKMVLLQINAGLIMREITSKMKGVLSVLLLNFKRRRKEHRLKMGQIVRMKIDPWIEDLISSMS